MCCSSCWFAGGKYINKKYWLSSRTPEGMEEKRKCRLISADLSWDTFLRETWSEEELNRTDFSEWESEWNVIYECNVNSIFEIQDCTIKQATNSDAFASILTRALAWRGHWNKVVLRVVSGDELHVQLNLLNLKGFDASDKMQSCPENKANANWT